MGLPLNTRDLKGGNFPGRGRKTFQKEEESER